MKHSDSRRVRRREVAPVDVALQRRYWRTAATSGGCVMCLHFRPTADEVASHGIDLKLLEGHHVLPQQLLKREGLHGKLWDVRNGLGLCRYHHARHESYAQRVPRDVVPNDAFDFADELGLGWAIDREYP